MSIDTANKRNNVNRMTTFFLVMGLAPTNGLDTDDRENAGDAYIGFSYVPSGTSGNVSRFSIGVGIGR